MSDRGLEGDEVAEEPERLALGFAEEIRAAGCCLRHSGPPDWLDMGLVNRLASADRLSSQMLQALLPT